jgi:hypothetical protein
MLPGEVANLERCYSMMIPTYSKLGSEFAEDVMKYGQEYMDLFPNGKARTEIQNCMNQAKAEGAKGVSEEKPAAAETPAAEAPAEETAPAAEAPAAEAAAEEAPAPAEDKAEEKSETADSTEESN